MFLPFSSVNKCFELSFRSNWSRPALSNYQGETMTYAQLCERIALFHEAFSLMGISSSEKIAICGRNQMNWAVAFYASMTYGAVTVPLLHEFRPEQAWNLSLHSDSRVLFVDEAIWEQMPKENLELSALLAVVKTGNLDFVYLHPSLGPSFREKLASSYEAKYPGGLAPDDINYYEDSPGELALINYTSGTSGFSKGVMLPFRSVWRNLEFSLQAIRHFPPEAELVSMLPLAHMYGLMFELLHTNLCGAHVRFLTRVPSPRIVLGAMQAVKPDVVIAVPLIIEKIYKTQIRKSADRLHVILSLPFLRRVASERIRKKVSDAFGGRFEEVIIGGAAVNREVERFFHKIGFRFTIGYGMTECGPIITYAHWTKTRLYSCGMPIEGCTVRIDSNNPSKIPGEILVKGDNVFLGYYKNEQASRDAFTPDGWFRTGDIGVMKDGYLYLRGRSKCMILSANGQNIYPEELEGIINTFEFVTESLVVDDKGALTAIIYPDYALASKQGISPSDLTLILTSRLPQINAQMPSYAQIKKLEFLKEDFERTPKRSIRRYLYQKER